MRWVSVLADILRVQLPLAQQAQTRNKGTKCQWTHVDKDPLNMELSTVWDCRSGLLTDAKELLDMTRMCTGFILSS